jgi:uncharacterized damage-inducible protein DinB/predicted RNase H-like HicB family nuclease
MPMIINQKRPYRVYIEEGTGGAMAHVAELPGCFAVGSTSSLAAGAVAPAIARFLQWLKGHREPIVPEAHVARPTVLDISIVEVLHSGSPTQAGSRAELFDFDKEPWDDYKLERTLRWLSYSRADLLLRVQGLTEQQMKSRLVLPGRTIWDTLLHVANAEYGYINRIAGPLDNVEPVTDDRPSDARERLAVVREILVRRVRAIPQDKRGEVILPTWANRPDEPWTLAKALRRALEHEREHTAEL